MADLLSGLTTTLTNLGKTVKNAAGKAANTVTGKKNGANAEVLIATNPEGANLLVATNAPRPQLGGKRRGRTARHRKRRTARHRKHKKTHRKH